MGQVNAVGMQATSPEISGADSSSRTSARSAYTNEPLELLRPVPSDIAIAQARTPNPRR
jgi:hypothetical protein